MFLAIRAEKVENQASMIDKHLQEYAQHKR